MHEFLRSIGFAHISSKKQIQALTDWVTEKPDRMNTVYVSPEGSTVVAERDVSACAGIAVVGETDEQGNLTPDYCFPYVSTVQMSSEAGVSWERRVSGNGYLGMCEDSRLTEPLIFNVKNIADVICGGQDDSPENGFRKVAFSALASEATVLLPVAAPACDARPDGEEANFKDAQILAEDELLAISRIAGNDFATYQKVLEQLSYSDVFSLVENFFMPYGMEPDRYYFMGNIVSSQLQKNEVSGEEFYRIMVEANGLPLCVAVNREDLKGAPAAGRRLKCHAWLNGELME